MKRWTLLVLDRCLQQPSMANVSSMIPKRSIQSSTKLPESKTMICFLRDVSPLFLLHQSLDTLKSLPTRFLVNLNGVLEPTNLKSSPDPFRFTLGINEALGE